MCLYPKIIKNKKYSSNKKNGGIIPVCNDDRTMYVPIGCGNCIECRNQKKRAWQVRLNEEIKCNSNGKFVTLTFSEESLKELIKEVGHGESNAVAAYAVRHYLERWRRKHKKSVRHWFITELGHINTERIHIHGIMFTDDCQSIVKHWKYGHVTIGKTRFKPDEWKNANGKTSYVSEKTINYIMKYVTKIDLDHKGYVSKIMCSAGLGKNYLNSYNASKNLFKDKKTKESYTTKSGHEMNLPIYYRNKIYTEEEREKLWINRLNKNELYIGGRVFKITNEKELLIAENYRTIKQAENELIGYGNDGDEWKKKDYNVSLRMLNNIKRESEFKKNNLKLHKTKKSQL